MKIHRLFALSLAFIFGCATNIGCSQNVPDDSKVIEVIESSDPLAKIGCVKYDSYQRLNGYGNERVYSVEYQILKVQLTTIEECGEKIQKTSNNDVINGLALIGELFTLGDLQLSGGKQNITGTINFIKSEKGWVQSK